MTKKLLDQHIFHVWIILFNGYKHLIDAASLPFEDFGLTLMDFVAILHVRCTVQTKSGIVQKKEQEKGKNLINQSKAAKPIHPFCKPSSLSFLNHNSPNF